MDPIEIVPSCKTCSELDLKIYTAIEAQTLAVSREVEVGIARYASLMKKVEMKMNNVGCTCGNDFIEAGLSAR